MPLLPCYFFNRFKINPDMKESYQKSLLEVFKVTGDGHCICESDTFKFTTADHDQI